MSSQTDQPSTHEAPSPEQTVRTIFHIILLGAAAFVGASLIIIR